MVVQISTLRVTSDFDASGYRAGMAQKVAADEAGTASSTAFGAALAKQDVATDNTGGALGRLSRGYIDGYGSSAKFYGGLANLQRLMETDNATVERATAIYQGLVQKFGMVADAAEAAKGGNADFAAVIEKVNAATDKTVVGLTGMGAGFDIARLKAEQAGQIFQSTLNESFGIGIGGKSARDSASVFEAAAKEADQFAAKAAALKAEIDPLTVLQGRYNAELAEYSTLASRGLITTRELADAEAMATGKFDASVIALGQATAAHQRHGNAVFLGNTQMMALFHTGRSMTEMLLQGVSPMQVMVMQINHLTYALSGPGGLKAAWNSVVAAGTAVAGFLGPGGMILIGLSAIAVAAMYLYNLIGGGGGKTVEEVLKRHKDLIDQITKAYSDANIEARKLGQIETAPLKAEGILQQIQLTNELLKARKELARPVSGFEGFSKFFSDWHVPQGFIDDAKKFREEIKKGTADVVAYRKALAERAVEFPTTESLNFVASEIKATQQTYDLGESQKELARAMRIASGQATVQDAILLHQVGTLHSAAIATWEITNALKGYAHVSMQTGDLAGRFGDAFGKSGVGTVDEAAALDLSQRRQAAELQALRARSPAEKAAAASAREAATAYSETETAAQRAFRIASAGAMAAANAEYTLSEAVRQRALSYAETLRSAQLDIDLVGKSVGEVARLRKEYELMAALRQEASANGIPISEENIRLAKEEALATGELVIQLAKKNAMSDLAFARTQIGRSSNEQQVAAMLRGIYGDNYQQYMDSAIAKQMRFNDELQTAKTLSTDFANTFVGDLMNGKTAVDSLSDALRNLSSSLIKMATDQAINLLFKNLIGALGGAVGGGASLTGGVGSVSTGYVMGGLNAKGNVYEYGRVTPYAIGGIVNRPTVFPMAGGAGLMGEAGPEAVMPLRRGSDGRLGVVAQSSGGHTINASVVINRGGGGGPEDDARAAKLAADAVHSMVLNVLDKERRTGGRLNPIH